MENFFGRLIRLESVDDSLSSLIFVVKCLAVECEVFDHGKLSRYFVANRRCKIVKEKPIRKNLLYVGKIEDEF